MESPRRGRIRGTLVVATLLIGPWPSVAPADAIYTVTDLGTAPASTDGFVRTRNASGQEIQITYPIGAPHTTVTGGGTTIDFNAPLGADSSVRANSINDAGQVVGTFSSDIRYDSQHAFVASGGALTPINAPDYGFGNEAIGINNAGLVVGQAVDPGSFLAHPFLFRNGSVVDLQRLLAPAALDWRFSAVQGIDDQDRILAVGVDPAGQSHSLLLTPTSTAAVTSAVAALGTTAVGPTIPTVIAPPFDPTTATSLLPQATPQLLPIPSDGLPAQPASAPEPSPLALFGLLAAAPAVRGLYRRRGARANHPHR